MLIVLAFKEKADAPEIKTFLDSFAVTARSARGKDGTGPAKPSP
jgi:hypothetical protein